MLQFKESDVPLKENRATKELSGHCEENIGHLRKKKSLDETVHRQHEDSSHVYVKRIDKQASTASCSHEGVGDTRFIGRPPSPIESPDRSRAVLLDDDDYTLEELKYSSADKGTVVADITNESDAACDGVILDSSGAAPDIAAWMKADSIP